MAKKKAGTGPTFAQKIRRAVLTLLLALALFLVGYMSLRANTLHVRRAVVTIPDLPAAFEGKTILYAADLDICGSNTPAKIIDLFQSLQALEPDILILGGDYTSGTLFERLNNTVDRDDTARQRTLDASALLRALSDFRAPLGRYAIATSDDGDRDVLEKLMRDNGITPVFDDCAAIRCGDGKIALLGMCDATSRVDISAYDLSASDCVIAAVASPECFPRLMTLEARGGGSLIDMALAGHTHGGQILLFGQTLLPLTFHERNYLYGWRRESGIPLLTTSGVGCEWINWRLGSGAEVWLIAMTSDR